MLQACLVKDLHQRISQDYLLPNHLSHWTKSLQLDETKNQNKKELDEKFFKNIKIFFI
jgi:hypothetical protein